ncbi:MAG TPA: sugar-binding protein [Longimicrobiales bacterium]
MHVIGAIALILAFHAGASAPQAIAPAGDPAAPRPATAQRADVPPTIDGRNDDAVWEAAPRFTEFRQFEPRVGVAPSLETAFQVAYDERNLYVYVRAYDPHPDSIMRALSRRDVRGRRIRSRC